MKLPTLLLTSATALSLLGSAIAQAPADARLRPLKDLDGYFPWEPSPTVDAWKIRAEAVKMQMRVALGIYPEPTRTPLNAFIHSRIEGDGYTVEKVFFESMPGFLVTGSLYRPTTPGPHPAVLCPHGHWPDGRFGLLDDGELQKELNQGQERDPQVGRSRFQALCVTLARMGCIAFHYDMLGYADSQQLSYELTHKFAKQRPEMNASENWGLYSPQAESHAQSVMGLQTWNSIRALDFIETLPDVDRQRMGCTGGSGGGTQTFILAALDERVKVPFPAVMVSTAMQGGCTCENACLLRIETGNVEFAALSAPRPVGMTSAKDWTIDMPTRGFPQLQRHWAMLGAPDAVALFHHPEFPHNYNAVSREHIYTWFAKHFGLPAADGPRERPYRVLTPQEMTVFNEQHPRPPAGDAFEVKLLRWWHQDTQRQVSAMAPEKIRLALNAIFLRTLSNERAEIDRTTFTKETRQGFLSMRATIRNAARGENVAALYLHPTQWKGHTALFLRGGGKETLLAGDAPIAEVRRLLDAGVSVIGIDLFTPEDSAVRRVKNPRESAAYTFGYNPTLFAQRVHDVLTTLASIRDDADHPSRHIALIALDGTAPIAAAARALAGDFIHSTAVAPRGFTFHSVNDFWSPHFQPALARFGDMPGLLRAGQGALWNGDKETGDPIAWLLQQWR